MNKFIFIFFLIVSSIAAQGVSVGLGFKGFAASRNLKSTFLLSLTGDYEIDNYNISLGAEFTLLDGFVNPFILSQPPPYRISDLAYGVGVTGKYYLAKSKSSTLIKPFVGIGIGYYFPSDNLYMAGMNIDCEEDYKFSSSYDFYTNFNVGILFFPKSKLSMIFNLTYQLRYPKVKYRKYINCSTVDYSASRPLIPVEYSESVNLSMLLWSLGVQVNL